VHPALIRYVIVMQCLHQHRHLYEGIHPIGFSSHCAIAHASSLCKIALKFVHGLTFKNRASCIWDGRTATLQMLHFIYFFSTNTSTEYFKHAAHSPFFSSKFRLFRNDTFFGSCIIHILRTGRAKI